MTVQARPTQPPLRGFMLEIPVRFAECDAYGVVWHGHYVLYLEQVSYDGASRPIEYSDVWIRGDRLRLSAWLRR